VNPENLSESECQRQIFALRNEINTHLSVADVDGADRKRELIGELECRIEEISDLTRKEGEVLEQPEAGQQEQDTEIDKATNLELAEWALEELGDSLMDKLYGTLSALNEPLAIEAAEQTAKAQNPAGVVWQLKTPRRGPAAHPLRGEGQGNCSRKRRRCRSKETRERGARAVPSGDSGPSRSLRSPRPGARGRAAAGLSHRL
jgi:hypothetical protein